MMLRTFRNSAKKVCAVGVKFEFELYDNFIGQFATTFFPHCDVDAFCRPMNFGAFKGVEWAELNYTKHFVSVLSYLMSLTCDALDASTLWCGDCKLSVASFPYEEFLYLTWKWRIVYRPCCCLWVSVALYDCGLVSTLFSSSVRNFPLAYISQVAPITVTVEGEAHVGFGDSLLESHSHQRDSDSNLVC